MMGPVDWRCSDHRQQEEQLETIPVGQDGRFFDPQKTLGPVRPDGRCEAHNVEVAAGDIFATLNSSQLLEITKDKKHTFPI
jgi:hypothetical protein